MSYLPIEDYGVIGNMRSVALIGKNASIDWYCFPHFDSPSIFATILDDHIGGFFRISPVNTEHKTKQSYWPDTNILITRFFVDGGIVEISDYMPVGEDIKGEKDYRIVRRVKGVHGAVKMKVECSPAFNYARDPHSLLINDSGAIFSTNKLRMGLASTIPLKAKKGMAYAEFEIKEEETYVLVFHKVDKNEKCIAFSEKQEHERFLATIGFWRQWLSRSLYEGRWREMVNRSALVLKLLTFEPTGAIIASPTCSLPEHIGGKRNWDYRYTWIRDAAFTVYAFMRIGFIEEAARFMDWILKRCQESSDSGSLQIMYGIDGRHELREERLDHLEGYKKSGPVYIGNAAYNQMQLDIYGELMDAAYLFNKHGNPIPYDMWQALANSAEYVCRNWNKKDEGIWEVRSGRQHFVYSKMMCWVALDRAIRLARKRSFPANKEKWIRVRNEIYRDIIEKGWSKERNAFKQHYDSDSLDAANLVMPLVFFMSPTDPLMIKTLEATMKSPSKGGLVTNSLVYRYNSSEFLDGLNGLEGTFNICTFWLVEALTRAGRGKPEKLEEARLVFEQILGYSNHLGLFSEEIGLGGEALGNTPQAFTHLALISSAFNLDKALG